MTDVMTDDELHYWGDVYRRLDDTYGIGREHGLWFEEFLKNPEHAETWIHIYFANPSLFIHRPNGAAILLPVFLDNGPQYILAGVLAMALAQADSEPEVRPLLPKQKRARDVMDYVMRFLAQEDADKAMPDTAAVHGGRYCQPMRHYAPVPSRKTRRAHI